jgi:hypothetical protein
MVLWRAPCLFSEWEQGLQSLPLLVSQVSSAHRQRAYSRSTRSANTP